MSDEMEDLFREIFDMKMDMNVVKKQLSEATNNGRPFLTKKRTSFWKKRLKENGLSDQEIEYKLESIEMYYSIKKQCGGKTGHGGYEDGIYLNDGMFITSDGEIHNE